MISVSVNQILLDFRGFSSNKIKDNGHNITLTFLFCFFIGGFRKTIKLDSYNRNISIN